ncbi:MAG: hypothetical protein AMJ90_00330 [candidate division Zixibacteria bacterium SM23_73_2]|nr:MAG: hypothetical protein AMJ90_00330 [candidate division Zixibacteria bacterium SM23_73_2]
MEQIKLIRKSWAKVFLDLIEPLARFLINLKVSPYVLTGAGLFFSILGFNFFRIGYLFFGGLMIILAGICDVLDGRLARESNSVSKYGALIDSVVDRYSEIFLFLGLLVYFWERSLTLVILIFLAVVGSLLVSYVRARAEGLGLECKVGIMQRQERMSYLAAGTILSPIPFMGNFLLILALTIIAVFSNFTVIQRVVYIKNQLKEKNL